MDKNGSQITYLQSEGRVWVYVGGKRAGPICHEQKGFVYYPKDSKIGGEPFPTLLECKRSLEEACAFSACHEAQERLNPLNRREDDDDLQQSTNERHDRKLA